ncbi:hypothetical protein ACQEVB_04645 [Pseudonocardia sp. CA-107938]|uniref:hypothetical protein n=1 Tax=Pseudonocardia sp. CA-107938 TaxID=3240021 RepID=UPI003D8E4A80
MRPPGVLERVRAVAAAERAIIRSWADRQLGLAMCSFISGCGRQGYSDHSVLTPIRMWRRVDSFVDDGGQRRTGSDFERRCLDAFEQLRPIVEPLAIPPDDVQLDAWDAAEPMIVDVPVRSVLGASDGPDPSFDLICWNEASALAEGNNTPYFAACAIVAVEIYRPSDPFGLLAPLGELRMRYEDEPDSRDATGAEIAAVLDDFRARAPWPIRA